MKSSVLRSILRKEPFRTIEIWTTSGRRYVVNHPESIALLRDHLVVLVEPDGGVDWFEASQVVDVRRGSASPNGRRKK